MKAATSGLSTLQKDHLAGGASRLAALLIAHLCPIRSLFAPCQAGAALRDLVLLQRGAATRSGLLAICCVLLPSAAGADPFSVPVTVTTAGSFWCLMFSPCFTGEGTNQISITGATGTAIVTFTGVQQTFAATNSVTQVRLGTFDVSATPGFTFPLNTANPELPIFEFRFLIAGQHDSDTLRWGFGPGGTTSLQQFGPWDLSVKADIDPAPYSGPVLQTNSPVLATNASTDLTADMGLVPEPSTMILIGTGLLGTVFARRRRHQAQSAS